ncbi:TetR/AcrR family transcriptional regulator [Mycobacterium sp. NPDC003449]
MSAASICESALTIIDREGAEALTVRRLAADMNISTRTLYKRIHDRDNLIRGVADMWASRIVVHVDDSETWARAAVSWCTALHRELVSHPHLAEIARDRILAECPSHLEALVDLGVGEGMSRGESIAYCTTLFTITVNDALALTRGRPSTGMDATADETPANENLAVVLGLILDGVAARTGRAAAQPHRSEQSVAALAIGW